MSQLKATLKNRAGKVLAQMMLPESAADISLVRYISFLNEMNRFDLPDSNPVEIMARAVSEFLEVDLSTVYAAELGQNWADNKEAVDGVRGVYGWAVRALSNYKGEARTAKDFSFKLKTRRVENGETVEYFETYKIPYIIASELAGGLPNLPAIETGEAIEAFETLRTYRQLVSEKGDPKGERARRIVQIKEAIVKNGDENGDLAREMRKLEAEIEVDGDPNGNLLFAKYLRLLAVLCRKEGERMPANSGDRERWIQERMIEFQAIDTKTALDVDFFLTGLLSLSKQMNAVIGSLILPLFGLAAAIQSKPQPKGRHTIKKFRIARRYKSGLAGVR